MSLTMGSAFGFSGVDWGASLIDRGWSKRDAADQNQWNIESQQRQMDFQERMSNTAYQRGTADMMAAGLNPMLAYHQGPAPAPQGGSALQAPATRSSIHSGGVQGLQGSAALALTEAQTRNVDAQTANIQAGTPTHAITRDKMNQEIAESEQRVKESIQNIQNLKAGERLSDQQLQNLKATIPQIEAMVRNLKAQTHASYTHSGLTAAQDEETRQRIRHNLPKVEEALGHIRAMREQFEMPRHAMDAQTHSSVVGAFSSLLRAINPLQGIFGTK